VNPQIFEIHVLPLQPDQFPPTKAGKGIDLARGPKRFRQFF
jgi:hypothetical protein